MIAIDSTEGKELEGGRGRKPLTGPVLFIGVLSHWEETTLRGMRKRRKALDRAWLGLRPARSEK